MGTGESAALTAAALWACASLFYSRTQLSAWQINFGKNFLASLVLCLHLFVVTSIGGRSMFAADSSTWVLLAISSVIGIVIGDTFYFRSLQILGPRRALMVSTTSPLFATIVGWVGLGEALTVVSLLGIVLTFSGITIVIAVPNAAQETAGYLPVSMTRGVVMGVLASPCNAFGASSSRMGTLGLEAFPASGSDPLGTTVIRFCVAASFSIVAALVTGTLIATARRSFRLARAEDLFAGCCMRSMAGDLDESDCVSTHSAGDRDHVDLHDAVVRHSNSSSCLRLSHHSSRYLWGCSGVGWRLSDRGRIADIRCQRFCVVAILPSIDDKIAKFL
jgi:drug/metabolite transporter (DMT)-like permease